VASATTLRIGADARLEDGATFECRLCAYPVHARPWGAAECPHCESVSVAQLPSHADIAAFYADYHLRYDGGGSSGGRNLERYARRYLQIVRRWRRGGRLIDVGSSNNPFPNHAAAAGFETTVLDFARPVGLDDKVRFIEGHLNDDKAAALGERFDVVTSWAVLEHVPDPPAAARRLAHLCRPGGLIVLSTPEVGTRLTRHALGHSPWFYPPEHLNLISPRAFEWMFEPLGCRLRHWGRLEWSWWRHAARNGVGVAGAIGGALVRTVRPRWWHVQRDTRVQAFQGVTYFVFEKRSDAA
jgi:SAM-dependent methyltransferase